MKLYACSRFSGRMEELLLSVIIQALLLVLKAMVPFSDPYQNFLKVDNHGGQSMTSVIWRWIPGSGDTWCQCQRIILTL